MSSSSRFPPERRAALLAALLLTVLGVQCAGTGRAVAAELDVVSVVGTGDGEVALVADVRPAPAAPLRPDAFSVAAGGRALPTRAVPVLSDGLAAAIVVDASAEARPALQGAVSGAAGLLLQLPAAARSAVVLDTDPPAVAAPLAAGVKDALGALDAVRPEGGRSTSEAVSLALRELPPAPREPRVLVLSTGAADAGGEPADELAGRLRRAGVLLAVVSGNAGTSYWSRVTADGGILVAAQAGRLPAAFDSVADRLRSRYLITFPVPDQVPTWVSVRVETQDGPVTADAYVPPGSAEGSGAADTPNGTLSRLLVVGGGVLGLLVGAVLFLAGRRASSSARPAGPARAGAGAAGPLDDDPDSSSEELAPVVALLTPRPAPEPAAARPAAEPGPAQDPPPEPALEPLREPTRALKPALEPAPGPADEAAARELRAETDPRPADAAAAPEPGAEADTGPADEDTPLYAYLDALVGNAAAAVADERLDREHAVAQIALAAAGRPDLLDRVAESERRMAGLRFSGWPPTATVLELIAGARRVAAGESALVGPAGVRVEQAVATGGDGSRRPVLRLTRDGRRVCDCPTVRELARHVDLASLLHDPRQGREPGRRQGR